VTEAILMVLSAVAAVVLIRIGWAVWRDRVEDAEAHAQMLRRYEAQREWEQRIIREAEAAACRRIRSRSPAPSRRAESRASGDTPQSHLYSLPGGSDSRSCDSDSSSCDSGGGGGD